MTNDEVSTKLYQLEHRVEMHSRRIDFLYEQIEKMLKRESIMMDTIKKIAGVCSNE